MPRKKRKVNTDDDELEKFNRSFGNVDVSSDDRQIEAFLDEPDVMHAIPEEDLLPSLSDPLGK